MAGESPRYFKSLPPRRYIIPPRMVESILRFEAHYRAAGNDPIIVLGPSGVGKTMFCDLFKVLFRMEFGDEVPILTINCSHYGGDLARSELFGYEKGAFTGAIVNKRGLIDEADGGVLVLEEIGNLPEPTQAALLTFIETGEYFQVGGRTPKRANVRVMAATNNDTELRFDFLQRFFPFYIPPIHTRRGDILYYLNSKFPQLVWNLFPCEILALIAYHWPGNIREIERVGRLIYREKHMASAAGYQSSYDVPVTYIPEFSNDDVDDCFVLIPFSLHGNEMPANVSAIYSLNHKLEKHKRLRDALFRIFDTGPISVNLLNTNRLDIIEQSQTGKKAMLRRWGMAFKQFSTRGSIIFNKCSRSRVHDPFTIQHKATFMVKEGAKSQLINRELTFVKVYIGAFEKVDDNIDTYCAIFFQNNKDNKNLLSLDTGSAYAPLFGEGIETNEDDDSDDSMIDVDYVNHPIANLEKEMLEFISGIRINGFTFPTPVNQHERDYFFLRLANRYPVNKFLKSLSSGDESAILTEELEDLEVPDIASMTFEQLLRSYYDSVLKKTNGNKAAAARIMQVNHRTFYSRLRKLGSGGQKHAD